MWERAVLSPTQRSPCIVTGQVLRSGAQLSMKAVSVRMWKPVSRELLDSSVLLRKPRPHVPACMPVPRAQPWAWTPCWTPGGLPASPPPPPVLDTRGPRSLVPTACVPGNLITLTPLLLSTQRGLSLYWLCCVSQRGLGTGLPTPRLSQSTRQLQRGEACAHQTAE